MTDKATFARKLMRINERVVASNTASAIFGSIGDLPQSVNQRARLRIGLFPCLSEDNALLAMGLWSTLAHLLDSWRDIEVYRLFVAFEGDPDDFVWTIDKSQFTLDDWDLENLDENIAIWGQLESTETGWTLTATIDDDNLTGEDADTKDVILTVVSQDELFAKLPQFALDIADTIGATRPDHTDPAYNVSDVPVDDNLLAFLEQLLEWDVNLLATLWDVEFDDSDVNDAIDDLISASQSVNTDFVAWSIAKSVAMTMKPGYSVIGDTLIDRVPKIVAQFDSDYIMPILAGAVFNMGFAPKAYRYLNEDLAKRPQNTIGWLKLAEILAEGGLVAQSVDAFQTAIEKEAVNSHLFRAYGNVLQMAERSATEITSFILIDLNEYEQDYLNWEAVEAYTEALILDPEDVRACYAKVLQLAEVDFEQEQLWEQFVTLIDLDEDGEYTADAIDSFYDVGDIGAGVEALQKRIETEPERVDLIMNLAALYIAGYEGDSAVPLLEKAQKLVSEARQLADIERMILMANNPEFEYRFGEIESILDAGNKLSADDVEFLEDVVENAPHAIEGHIALGRSYYYWQEYDEALEVLLDAQESFPDQPVVLDWLARILWESGERDTAFTYLNRGILAHPFNVQLIARAGQYLFDNNQLDEARRYLARAEEIAPRHPMLNAVRRYIAQQMEANPQKYAD